MLIEAEQLTKSKPPRHRPTMDKMLPVASQWKKAADPMELVSVFFCISENNREKQYALVNLATVFDFESFVSPHHMKPRENVKVELQLPRASVALFLARLKLIENPEDTYCPQMAW